MEERSPLALRLLGAALALGVLGDALLRGAGLGINVLLWTAALLTAVVALARWRPALAPAGWLVGPALLFAAAFAWRDSLALNALAALALFTLGGLALLRGQTGRYAVGSLAEYTLGLGERWLRVGCGPVPLLRTDVSWEAVGRAGAPRQAAGVLRGLLLAAPLLLLFGVLFAAADAMFASYLGRWGEWLANDLLARAALALALAWVTAGLLRGLFFPDDEEEPGLASPAAEEQETAPPAPALAGSLGITEIGVALGALNLLFLAFILVQARYLFGGAEVVAATTGLTYAEYARRGFFELATVTALTLPVLLLADCLLRRDGPADERLFRLLAGALLALLAVVVASALQRMLLYTQQYGLTELRLYTTAFMGWLAAVGGWYALTALRGRRERFAWGAVAAGLAAVFLLHAVNPDALIARANTARAERQAFDAAYAASLSADAVPTLLAALPSLPEAQRAGLARRLAARWRPPERADWRAWNASRSRAYRAVAAALPEFGQDLQELQEVGEGEGR